MKKRIASDRNPLSAKVGNNDAPKALREGQKNFVIGLDDCVCCTDPDSPVDSCAIMVSQAQEVDGARDWLNNLIEQGHLICFFTQRPERQRKLTELWLDNHGFKYHSLVMGKPIARNYHYIDDRHVQATTFTGKYAHLITREHRIQVFR